MPKLRDHDFEAVFSSGTFVVVRDANLGFVSRHPTLRVSPNKGTRDDFNTSVHEGLHAEFADLTEARVDKAAGHITDFLWALGYRWAMKPKKRRKKRKK